MNAYVAAGIAALWGVSLAGAGWFVYQAGGDRCRAAQAEQQALVNAAAEAAGDRAAAVFSKMEFKHVTIRQPLETIVRENTVFRDCRSGDDARRLLNSTPGVAGAVPAAAASGVRGGTGAAGG